MAIIVHDRREHYLRYEFTRMYLPRKIWYLHGSKSGFEWCILLSGLREQWVLTRCHRLWSNSILPAFIDNVVFCLTSVYLVNSFFFWSTIYLCVSLSFLGPDFISTSRHSVVCEPKSVGVVLAFDESPSCISFPKPPLVNEVQNLHHPWFGSEGIIIMSRDERRHNLNATNSCYIRSTPP